MSNVKVYINKKQIIKAENFLKTLGGSEIGKTKNYYFQTSNSNFVFEVEKPAIRPNIFGTIMADFIDVIFEIDVTQLTGHSKKLQYSTPWPNCYVWKRADGYLNKGDHYFDY